MRNVKKVFSYLGLAPALSRLRYYSEVLKYYKGNQDFLKKHKISSIPLYNVFETYGADLNKYFTDGESTAEWIFMKIQPYLNSKDVNLVCEWGVGMGRLVRNFPLYFPSARITGYDYNEEYVECCKLNYPGISFYFNHILPPLPECSNSSINVLVAVSIFTHLGESTIREWLNEFALKIAPGGIFFFTTHGNGFFHRLPMQEQKLFASGQIVEWKQGSEGKRTFGSFHPKSYVLNAIPNVFEVLEHLEGRRNEQDTWILKRLDKDLVL